MKRVRDLLNAKGRDVWSIAPDDNVYDAIKMMSEKSVGALLVMKGPALAGILSERDYARRVILKGKSSKATPVGDIMTVKVVTVTEDLTVDACMGLMTDKRIRHLPVVEGERVVGVLSIGDVLSAAIADKEALIQDLHKYIAS